MPLEAKTPRPDEAKPRRKTRLALPAVGMESEFNVWVDEVEVVPETYWQHPKDFIDAPLLKRTGKSSQLPTGGAVYFDRGVIEVVTPVIELAPGCSARVVRSLWEQISFVRDQLTQWEKRTGHTVRLKAYSCHYNISFELRRHQQNRFRNIRRLALLLSYLLPVPIMVLGGNRRSTGVGVRPRGDRIEITVDFTPDAGLTIATASLIVGIVREVMSWPAYRLKLLRELPLPIVAGVIPGKHTTRKGWLTKDFHYPQSPYTSDINAPIWKTQFGDKRSLREMAYEVAHFFRRSIRKYSDPFSFRFLFAILEGRAPSLLELTDRPAAYEDVGRLCRWGMVIHELEHYESEHAMRSVRNELWKSGTFDQFVETREREKIRVQARKSDFGDPPFTKKGKYALQETSITGTGDGASAISLLEKPAAKSGNGGTRKRAVSKRKTDGASSLLPPRPSDYIDRRGASSSGAAASERRRKDRRARSYAIPFPDRRLTRSAYESVFLKLVSGGRLRIGQETYTPVGMKGWYQAIFRRDSDGRERLLTIDQLLKKMNDWQY